MTRSRTIFHKRLPVFPESDYDQWASWFEVLPAVIETPYTVVAHSRLDPDLPLDRQDPYHTCAVGGPGITIELDENGVPLWYHQWREKHGAEKPILVSSKPSRRPARRSPSSRTAKRRIL
ncbi:MAG: hypothetical protein GY866_08225 [Proteobacteria bacterium]|nr:hypothetical protein [Pseudomonadota bacterium]